MKRKASLSYDQRYRHKLNMLEPGTVMLRICAALAAAEHTVEPCFPALLFLVLLVLVGVELHQDRVLNELAVRENQNREEIK